MTDFINQTKTAIKVILITLFVLLLGYCVGRGPKGFLKDILSFSTTLICLFIYGLFFAAVILGV